MNEQALEAAAQAMCDRVNGQGDYAENIGQRRIGWLAQAKTGIAAYLASTGEGLTSREGWKLVPVKPTEAMCEAATEIDVDTIVSHPTRLNWEEAAAIYRAMLASVNDGGQK